MKEGTDDPGSIGELLDLRLNTGDIDAIAAWVSLNEVRVETEILGGRAEPGGWIGHVELRVLPAGAETDGGRHPADPDAGVPALLVAVRLFRPFERRARSLEVLRTVGIRPVKNGNSSWHTGNFHADVHFEFEARMRNDEWPALAEAEGRSAPSAHERLEAAAEGRRSLRAKAGLSEEAGLSDGG